MSSTSSTSTSSFLSGNRTAGLISGLDTEELVKSMAANTKSRLNAKKQKLQTLQWKQESYRSSISKITAFQNKYLTVSSATSIKANAVMNKFKADSSDSKVSATASSTALPDTYHIKSATAAAAATVASTGSVSADKISLDFSGNKAGETYDVSMVLDGTKLTVSFKAGANEAETKANFLAAANDSFKNLKTDAQGFEFKDGTTDLVFNNNGDDIYHTFEVGYNKEGVGLSNTTSSKMSNGSALGDIAFAKTLEKNSDGKYKMSINGVNFEFNDTTTISGMVSTINASSAGVKMSFSSVSQSFQLESTTTGTAGSIKIEQSGSNLANVLFNTDADLSEKVYGTNSTISVSTDGVNYTTYTSASNDYTFDGTTINISKLGDFDSSVEDVEEITVTTGRDTSSIKDTVVNFVNDYNEMLSELNKLVSTSRPKSNGSYYDPLTEEQEDEMESDEITKWNDQAKQGLLYHDSYISKFISSVRTTMTSSLDGFSLSDMGITVSSDLTDNGKLVIDEDKLDSSIASYGEQISKFFTDTTNGLAAKLTTTVDKAVSKTTNNYGYLTQVAGIENTASEKKNSLYSQITSLQNLISNLEDKYDNELERYWSKFTTLETYMSNMQNQSSIFSTE